MPARNEIQEEILNHKAKGQDFVRRKYLSRLADLTHRDTILYASGFSSQKAPEIPGAVFAITTDDIQGFMSALHGLTGESLDLILHSPGGSMEAADQLVQYLRAKYSHIRAIIPQNAMSAATMIACACDSIVMGKHSALGPIDPQVTFPTPTGMFTAPAQAILDEFEQAKAEIRTDPSTIPLWASKIQALPHGFLQLCQTTLSLSKAKVASWLAEYMFRGEPDSQIKGDAIANWLGDASEHKTHGRPITIQQAREHGIKVEALEDDQDFQEAILSVYHASMVTFQVTSCVKIVENHNGRGLYTQVQLRGVPVSSN
jgi:ATP-dependent protease ClpP protease subunit